MERVELKHIIKQLHYIYCKKWCVKPWKVHLFFKPMIKIRIWYHASADLDACILKYITLHIFLFYNKSYTTLTISSMASFFFNHCIYVYIYSDADSTTNSATEAQTISSSQRTTDNAKSSGSTPHIPKTFLLMLVKPSYI